MKKLLILGLSAFFVLSVTNLALAKKNDDWGDKGWKWNGFSSKAYGKSNWKDKGHFDHNKYDFDKHNKGPHCPKDDWNPPAPPGCVTPEPVSSALFLLGGGALALKGVFKRKKI